MVEYLPFLVGLIMICTVSFWDDVHSLPDSLRMVVQILSILLMFWSVGLYSTISPWWLMAVVVVVTLFFCVGATNFINFMDGINGITAAYALVMLAPIALVNGAWLKVHGQLTVNGSRLILVQGQLTVHGSGLMVHDNL